MAEQYDEVSDKIMGSFLLVTSAVGLILNIPSCLYFFKLSTRYN